jgi:hypothetical protein
MRKFYPVRQMHRFPKHNLQAPTHPKDSYDCILVYNTTALDCHMQVLRRYSEIFTRELLYAPFKAHENGVRLINCNTWLTLKSYRLMLKYMYDGCMDLPLSHNASDLANVLLLAHYYRINTLYRQALSELLDSTLDSECIVDVLTAATKVK